MLSVKPSDIKYHFWVFGMAQPGIEPQSSQTIGKLSSFSENFKFL